MIEQHPRNRPAHQKPKFSVARRPVNHNPVLLRQLVARSAERERVVQRDFPARSARLPLMHLQLVSSPAAATAVLVTGFDIRLHQPLSRRLLGLRLALLEGARERLLEIRQHYAAAPFRFA